MLEVEVVPPGVSREPCIAIHGSAGGVRRIRRKGVPSASPNTARLLLPLTYGEQHKEQGAEKGHVQNVESLRSSAEELEFQ